MGTPVTVTLTSQKTAWTEINDAIKKTLKENGAALNKQARADLQTQAAATSDSEALQLVSDQLNGPVTGFHIPTEYELYVPLRTIMQKSFPCANDPFNDEPYKPADNAIYLTSTSPASSPPANPQLNYILQRLQYLSLHNPFSTDLSYYQNYSNLFLEDEALADLEKRITTDINSYLNVTDMQQWLTNAWQAQQASTSSPVSSSPPAALLILPPLTQAQFTEARDWLSKTANDTIMDEVTSQYIQELTGDNSTVFPNATGKTFLENLSALLYGNIKSELSPKLQKSLEKKTKIDQDLGRTLAANSKSDKATIVDSLPRLEAGIDITLFEQLAGVGIQGMLLADIFDYEKSLELQQSMNSLLDSLAQYTTLTTAANADASNVAQSLLATQADLDSYYGVWQQANLLVNQNAQISGGGGNNINTQIANAFNGTGNPPMQNYLTYMLSGANATIDIALDFSTNISVQLAGLNFIAQSAMVPDPTQDNVKNLVTTINTQVQSDITQLQTTFTSYANSIAKYLSDEQLYLANNDVLVAQTGVTADVKSIVSSNNQPKSN